MPEVTEWLLRLKGGDASALDELLPLLYEELRELAVHRKAGERQHHTLTATALVHETYLRMLKQRRLTASDRTEFMAIAAVTMRRVLVDYARARRRDKRGGSAEVLHLEEGMAFLSVEESREVLDLNDALGRLEKKSQRAADVVQLRFFGGMTLEEIAGYRAAVHQDLPRTTLWPIA